MSEPVFESLSVEALAEEFLERRRKGERPTVAEYVARYPQLADEIRAFFPVLGLVEEFKPGTGDHTGSFGGATLPGLSTPLERLGDFRILREVGRGGMGVVYEAEQESLGRRVALKVLAGRHLLDPKLLVRFHREAKAAARLHHSNIVPVFGVGEQDGVHYYVMQFIPGLGLDEVLVELRRLQAPPPNGQPMPATVKEASRAADVAQSLLTGSFCPAQGAEPIEDPSPPPSETRVSATSSVALLAQSELSAASSSAQQYARSVARIGVQVADALEHAHQQGTLHRDIKPSNLLLDAHGTVWVTDFGLAKVAAEDDLTHTGDIVGTIRYVAPERFQGKCDARSDVYALGLTLYELLAKQPAFTANDRNELIRQVTQEEPRRLRQVDPTISRDLETIVHKAIEKDPAHRYASAAALTDDLRRFVEDRPITARRIGGGERCWRWCRRNPAVASLLAALVVVFVAGFAGVTWKWLEADKARQQAVAREQEIRESVQKLNAANAALLIANLHADEQRWDRAAEKYAEAIHQRPDHTFVWVHLADFHRRLGLWDRVAADYARLFEIEEPGFHFHWFLAALARLMNDDEKGYSELCVQMLRKPIADVVWSDMVVRTCNLSPRAAADAQRLPLLDRVCPADLVQYRWVRCYLLGTAQYRAGQYTEAIRSLREGLAASTFVNRGVIHPVLAMAYFRAGNVEDARTELAIARRLLDQRAQAALRDPTQYSPNRYWYDWLELQIYCREAAQLIEGMPPPVDARWLIARGKALALLQDHREATATFAQAARLAPNDFEVRAECFRYHAQSSHWALADRELEQLLRLKAQSRPFWLEASRLCAENGKPERAAAILARAAELWPNDMPLRLERFRLHAERGEMDLARAAAAELSAHRPDDPAFHLACADAYAEMGQWAEARTELEHAQKLGAMASEVWLNYAAVLLLLGDEPAYRRYCQELLDREHDAEGLRAQHLVLACTALPAAVSDPARLVPIAERTREALSKPAYLGTLGAAQFRAGQYKEAAATLEEALRTGKVGDGLSHMKMVMSLTQGDLGQPRLAVEWLEADGNWRNKFSFHPRQYPWAKEGPTWAYAAVTQLLGREAQQRIGPSPLLTARDAMRQQDWARAITALDRLLGPDARHPSDWLLRARCHAALRNWERARDDYARVIELGSNDVQGVWYPCAVLYLETGRLAEYQQLCQLAMRRFGSTTRVEVATPLVVLCKLHAQAGIDLEPVRDLAERLATYRGLPGQLLYRQGKFQEAAAWLDGMVPEQQNVWDRLVLAMSQGRLGRLAEARRLLEQCRAEVAERSGRIHWTGELDLRLLLREAEAEARKGDWGDTPLRPTED